MVLVCANVALLLFARAAAREGEIAIRTALGASRERIVAQLFAETLALAGVGALLGVAGAAFLPLVARALWSVRPTLGVGALLLAYVAVMVAVCLLACVLPTLRALRIAPTAALASEG
jgi:ABC-type antimicrobial peptide transport system permease subunit